MFEVFNADGSPLDDNDRALFAVARAIVNNFPDAFQDREYLAIRGLIVMVKLGLYDGTLTELDVECLHGKLCEAIAICSLGEVHG